jgi:hypothetical protein
LLSAMDFARRDVPPKLVEKAGYFLVIPFS